MIDGLESTPVKLPPRDRRANFQPIRLFIMAHLSEKKDL